jgi:hypothetical protein
MDEIVDYLAMPYLAFWRWEDHGQIAAWWDGRTIAFKAELATAIETLAPRGLPPFGALLLVYAACRENAEEEPSRTGQLAALLEYFSGDQSLLDQVAPCLKVVHGAWQELQGVPNVKSKLAYVIFHAMRGAKTSASWSKELPTVLANPELFTIERAFDNVACRKSLLESLGAVYEALQGVTVEQLCLRMRTGVDDAPSPAPLDTPPPLRGTALDLLRTLEDDEQLGGVARLARMVLATLNLPRAVSDPDELPDGGLSDITNRGSLDRLLLSELANDDLTLAMRVALREALYLRRETPPRTPPRQRAVLIDCGLRLWGVPRVFATAVGLAITAGSKQSYEVATWRTSGGTLERCDFTTRAGVVTHLEALDYSAHPGRAFSALVAELEDAEEGQELVLVTSEEALSDLEFLTTLAKLPRDASLFIATVNREGRYRLQARTAAGMRLLKEAEFALDDVFERRPQREIKLKSTVGREGLPAIYYRQPFPLLLSAAVHVERAWHQGQHAYSLTRDGRLLRWSAPHRGGEQLAEGLPAGHVHWVDPRADGLRFVVGPLRKTGLHLVNVLQHDASGSAEVVPLELRYEQPKAVAGFAGTVFVIYSHACEAFDAATGKFLRQRRLEPGMVSQRGRFFAEIERPHGKTWYGLACEGDSLELHRLQHTYDSRTITTLIDWRTLAIIQSDGHAKFSEGPDWKFAEREQVRGQATLVSRTGRFVLYLPDNRNPRALLLVDLELKQTTQYTGQIPPYLEPLLGQFARPRTLRHRFREIGVDDNDRLILFTARGDAWPIHYSRPFIVSLPKDPVKGVACRERIRFVDVDDSSISPYDLRIARWPDGSQAILDSRGLLHLRSADPSIRECTLVLGEGETAGWVSDGRVWGSPYFLGERRPESSEKIWNTVIAPFLRRLL